MDKKRLIVIVCVVLAAIVAALLSVTVFSNSDGDKKQSEPRDQSSAVANRDANHASPSPTMIVPVPGQSDSPIVEPTVSPMAKPSIPPSASPSRRPLLAQTLPPQIPAPTNPPTMQPTVHPTPNPTTLEPTAYPTNRFGCQKTSPASCSYTIFYAIADVPYTDLEREQLPLQVLSIPDNAEFLIHLGDIRSAAKEDSCRLGEYKDIAATLKLAPVPVFIVVGDNEWNDCANIDEGWGFWHQELLRFEDNWNHSFKVTRPASRPENFAFVHKRTLFVGLNLVGGRVHSQGEWTARLTEQAIWVTQLMRKHTGGDLSQEQIRAVCLFGHANPTQDHDLFFAPLRYYIFNELRSDIPVMYMNGDAHIWSYDTSFLGQEQFLRIQLTGGTTEPPLQVVIAPTDDVVDSIPENVFLYDRRL